MPSERRHITAVLWDARAKPVYTGFIDTRGAVEDKAVAIYPMTGDIYRRRVTQFIRDHQDHLAIAKLRRLPVGP